MQPCPLLEEQMERLIELENQVQINTGIIAEHQKVQVDQQTTLNTICVTVGTIAKSHSETNKRLADLQDSTHEVVSLMQTAKGVQTMVKFTTPFFLGVTAAVGAVLALWALAVNFFREPM